MTTQRKWSQLSAPVDPLDNWILARAMSVMHNLADVRGLAVEQLRDIVAWADSRLPLGDAPRAVH